MLHSTFPDMALLPFEYGGLMDKNIKLLAYSFYDWINARVMYIKITPGRNTVTQRTKLQFRIIRLEWFAINIAPTGYRKIFCTIQWHRISFYFMYWMKLDSPNFNSSLSLIKLKALPISFLVFIKISSPIIVRNFYNITKIRNFNWTQWYICLFFQ